MNNRIFNRLCDLSLTALSQESLAVEAIPEFVERISRAAGLSSIRVTGWTPTFHPCKRHPSWSGWVTGTMSARANNHIHDIWCPILGARVNSGVSGVANSGYFQYHITVFKRNLEQPYPFSQSLQTYKKSKILRKSVNTCAVTHK